MIEKSQRPWRSASLVLLAALGIAVALAVAPALPYMIDWTEGFRPAVFALLRGESPYDVPGFYHAPWTLIILLPLAILPEAVGRAALVIAAATAWAFVGAKLRARPIALVLALVSPWAINGFFYGNIDWLVMLGFVLPARWGLLLAVIKPQIGIAYIVWYAIEAWRKGGWRKVLGDFSPLVILFGLSIVLYGFWPLTWRDQLTFNRSVIDLIGTTKLYLWPYLLPLGMVALMHALKTRQGEWVMASGICFSPHLTSYSLQVPLMTLTRSFALTLAAVAGSWLVVVILVLSR